MMTSSRGPGYAALAASALILACVNQAETPSPTDATGDLERVRAATTRFHDMAAAQAAGYPSTVPPCLENPPEGGMGLHYVNKDLLDDHLDVEHPEILVYAPTSSGAPRLVGVEYIVPLSKWSAPEAPRIFGRELKRSEALKIWYLHVWSWEENEKGLFADWNPAVQC